MMVYVLLTYCVYVYAFQLPGNSDLKFFIIRHYYQDSIIDLIYKYIPLLCYSSVIHSQC